MHARIVAIQFAACLLSCWPTSDAAAQNRSGNDMPPVDPQCQAFLDVIKVAGGPSWEEMGVAQSRLTFDALDAVFGTGPADVQATDLKIDGRIPIRVYRRDAEVGTPPVLVFFHGGGWVLGNLNIIKKCYILIKYQ